MGVMKNEFFKIVKIAKHLMKSGWKEQQIAIVLSYHYLTNEKDDVVKNVIKTAKEEMNMEKTH